MHRRTRHRRGIRRSRILGVAVGGPTLAAMALAFGAPEAASAAPAPPAPAIKATAPATAPATATSTSVPGSVGTVPVVGPLVAPAPVSSQPASPSPTTNSVKAQGSPTLQVNPNSNLTNGQVVQISGSGWTPNNPGGMAECNSTPNQPTMSVEGNNQVPVGCTNPLQSLKTINSQGQIPPGTTFTIKTGTVGPPQPGKDSAGNDGAADSAKYPCPPTPAQTAAGATCGISFGDAAGEQQTANITFASSASATSSNGGATGTTAAGGGGAAGGATGNTGAGGASGSASGPTAGATDASGGGGAGASGGSLPFTGFGVGMWRLMVLGVLLVMLGATMVVLARRPGAVSRRVKRVTALVASAADAWSVTGTAGRARHRRRRAQPRVLAGH